MKEEKQKEAQQKYVELQMVDRQLKQIQQQMQALESQSGELELVQSALDDFKSAKVGSDMFVTMTPGILVKAKLESNDFVLLNVGANTVVQKSIPDAKKILSEQTVEMRKLQQELAGQMNKLAQHAEKVQDELRKLIE